MRNFTFKRQLLFVMFMLLGCLSIQAADEGLITKQITIKLDKAGSLPEKIGTIPIVQFDCPEALEQGHNNKMVYNDESGAPKIIKDSENIRQYATEVSNTNIYDEINDMMRLNTSMIASLNLMKVADDMYNKAINIRE